ncbi:hypothetical protein [Runella slithyformis]|uniref:Uncharacterized protein n=1 Tax=Runella slithyformis (strain ATCC 29530 / DSM 19594 / LMG 11500 / NCIMB 11436 / LSU 4) TaxID=761193 RepID=A0A7U4E4Z2_RUNSL|nr:hypothetical protein [Runella slithyformis]AEI47653.1 hypothetical protein Runsl_1225 [Runella slithyformis DSM 19594]
MKELIELLNHTSPVRTVFYCVVGLIALLIIGDVITNLFSNLALAVSRIFEKKS